MRVFVTGATGFVGRHLVGALVERGHGVRCLVRPTSRREGLEGMAGVEFFEGDVTDASSLAGAAQGCTLAYHLCAEGHVSAVSEEAYRRFAAVNVAGTRNVIEECARAGVRRFVHFSSTAAMGLVRAPLLDETTPPAPRTPYQRSKLESERAALALGRERGVEVIVLRPCMIYGPGGRGEFYKFCRLMRRGLFPRVGLGPNLTPLVHVRDVVQAALKAAERGRAGQVYLIAGARSVPLAEMRRHVLRAYGVWRPYWYVPVWLMVAAAWCAERLAKARGRAPVVTVRNVLSTVASRQFSIEKARRELGYEPEVDPAAGIPETVAWFIEQERGVGTVR